MNEKKINNKKKYIKVVLFVFLMIIFVYSTTNIFWLVTDTNKNKKIYDKVIEEVVKEDNQQLHIDFEALRKINSDTIAWIRLNQNKINYPIVQAIDNEYYLKRAFDQSINRLGSIFLDYRNHEFNDKNTIIYGHNSYDVTMFGTLKDTFNQTFFEKEENNYIEIALPTRNLYYQIFSVYSIEKEEYYIDPTPTHYREFLITIINRSEVTLNHDINADDKILTLSTCFGWQETGTTARLVIHAKMVKEIKR